MSGPEVFKGEFEISQGLITPDKPVGPLLEPLDDRFDNLVKRNLERFSTQLLTNSGFFKAFWVYIGSLNTKLGVSQRLTEHMTVNSDLILVLLDSASGNLRRSEPSRFYFLEPRELRVSSWGIPISPALEGNLMAFMNQLSAEPLFCDVAGTTRLLNSPVGLYTFHSAGLVSYPRIDVSHF